MCADNEARSGTARLLIDKALPAGTFVCVEGSEKPAKFAAAEITHDRLIAKSATKAHWIHPELAGLMTVFLERMAEAQVATLSKLNQQHAPELRRIVRKLASLLQFTWNGRFFTSEVLNGPTTQGVLFCFGKEPCPEFLILTFQSSLVQGPNGRRTAIIYSIETMQQVLDVILHALIGSDTLSDAPHA